MSAQALRILVVLPFYGGSLPIGNYCVQALRHLGHSVEVFEAPLFYTAFTAMKSLRITTDRLDQLEGAFLQNISQAILAQVESFEPDMVLALAQAPMSRQLLRRLEKMQIPTAMWFVEDHTVFSYWRAFAPLYSVFAVIQKDPFLQALEEVGQKNALYLPMAALPSFHAPQALSLGEQKTFGADVAFLGAGYPNRRLAFKPLTKYPNFKIWGTEWDGASQLMRHVQQGGARVSAEDSVKIYNATKVNLNLHSSVQTSTVITEGDFVNPRTFELASIGAFQLVDKRSLMAELFPEEMLATFESLDEMYAKVEYYLQNEEERHAMAQKAQVHVHTEHSYEKRMQCLLEYVEKTCGPWKPRNYTAGFADVPEHLRDDLAQLFDTLQLPAQAQFEDVMVRIRQRSGNLSPLETTLLFLDEWRKQYTK